MARTIHVHAAEVSTDADAVGAYAHAIATVLCIAAVALAAWIAMTPSPAAELAQPQLPAPAGNVAVEPLLPPVPFSTPSQAPRSPVLLPGT